MKKICVLFFISISLFAQYSQNDYELVKSNYFKSFDKKIISQYLFASTDDSVKAGLLSVAHSEDTSWVNEIIKLNFSKYGNYISFALGELGQSKTSTNYLMDWIFKSTSNKHLRESYEAIGRTADSSDIKVLYENMQLVSPDKLVGLPYALNNINSRFPIPFKDEFIDYLIEEINQNDSQERRFDALFVLSRLGGTENANQIIVNILKQNNVDNSVKYYALSCLRRVSYFPQDEKLFSDLINDSDPRIRTEAVRTICFYNFDNKEIVDKYLGMLNDSNPNVSRQTAISIGSINKITEELKNNLYKKVYELIADNNLTNNTRGELFVNYCNYKKENYLEIINEFDTEINDEFVYRVLSNNISNPSNNFEYIKENINDTTEFDFLNITQAALALQDSLPGNVEFNKFILSILNSSSPLGTALVAYSLDSTLIANNINALQQIIIEQVFKYNNDKNYNETLMALYGLAEKISDAFAKEVLQILKTSDIKYVKSNAKEILDEEIIPEETKDMDFDKLWEFSFKYSKAKVNTEKGSFVIEFTPQYSPISVGNFCYLTSQNYFDNVIFHRVVPNFVVQTGDPTSTGWGGPGYEIVSEFSLQPFDEAYVGMASAGKDTEGSQWFVMHSNFPHLNWRYSNFGKVIEGMEVVNKVDQKDKIINIELIK